MAKALTMREGLANSMGFNVIQAELDSMETIEGCTGDKVWWNESSAIFADFVYFVSPIVRGKSTRIYMI
jgi:hypothetical protein